MFVPNASVALYGEQRAGLASTDRVILTGEAATRLTTESGNVILRAAGRHTLDIEALHKVDMVGLAGELHYTGTSSVLAQSKANVFIKGNKVSLGEHSGIGGGSSSVLFRSTNSQTLFRASTSQTRLRASGTLTLYSDSTATATSFGIATVQASAMAERVLVRAPRGDVSLAGKECSVSSSDAYLRGKATARLDASAGIDTVGQSIVAQSGEALAMVAHRVQAFSPLTATFQSSVDTHLSASKIWAQSRTGSMQVSSGVLNAAAAFVAMAAQRDVLVAAASGASLLRAVRGDTLVQSNNELAVSATLGAVGVTSAGSASATGAHQMFQATESGLIESPISVSLAGSEIVVLTSNSFSQFAAQTLSTVAQGSNSVAATGAALVRAHQTAKLQSFTGAAAIVSQGSIATLKLTAAASLRLSTSQGTVSVV